MTTTADPGKALLDRIAELEIIRARVEAETAQVMLQFQDLRRDQAARHDDPRHEALEASFAADELGVALHQPTRTVQCRLAETRRVRALLPGTWEAFEAGRVDGFRVSLIASTLGKLTDNYQVADLDQAVKYAETHTTAQLKAKLKRFVATRVPAPAAAKTEHEKRRVWVEHQDDGMSFLHAYLPTPDVIRIDAQLTDKAKQAPSDDDRSFDQVRADEFLTLLRGTGSSESTSSRAVIGITVPITSLTGLDDLPGESFDGSFALPADMVRELLDQPGTLWFRILTDPLGRVLDTTEPSTVPSAALRTSIQARDGTCRFPTCQVPAMESDLDHKIPLPHGPTNGDNLRGLCRRHHRHKTAHLVEPTTIHMQPRLGSARERDLATFAINIQYAA